MNERHQRATVKFALTIRLRTPTHGHAHNDTHQTIRKYHTKATGPAATAVIAVVCQDALLAAGLKNV